MALKAGIYKSTKGNVLVIAEDGRNLWALYDENNKQAPFGKREKWPPKYRDYTEFVKGQGLVRTGDWNGVFF
jgi:hypothetical protein